MKIKFTEIPDRLNYPPAYKGQISTIHSKIVEAAADEYVGTFKQRQKIISVMNTVSAMIVSGDSISNDMSGSQLIDQLDLMDEGLCKTVLKSAYIVEKDIVWDLEVVTTPDDVSASTHLPEVTQRVTPVPISAAQLDEAPTPKEDLYLKPPSVPQMNIKQPWRASLIDNTPYVIYTSYPEIPTKQNEISCTTDVDKMTTKDLYHLFPNRLIQTRASSMYEYTPTLTYNESLGNVIPVLGYTDKQLIDNLIRYPHIFKLMRKVNDEFVSFYSHIEIGGELHRVANIWNSLPESKVIPFSQEYIKEYVVRRYLLERDISHIQHKYPMYGTLDPFLTLFMPASMYVSFGYRNTLDIAKQCVQSRISYKQSRNPVLRRITNA